MRSLRRLHDQYKKKHECKQNFDTFCKKFVNGVQLRLYITGTIHSPSGSPEGNLIFLFFDLLKLHGKCLLCCPSFGLIAAWACVLFKYLIAHYVNQPCDKNC